VQIPAQALRCADVADALQALQLRQQAVRAMLEQRCYQPISLAFGGPALDGNLDGAGAGAADVLRRVRWDQLLVGSLHARLAEAFGNARYSSVP